MESITLVFRRHLFCTLTLCLVEKCLKNSCSKTIMSTTVSLSSSLPRVVLHFPHLETERRFINSNFLATNPECLDYLKPFKDLLALVPSSSTYYILVQE